MKQAIIIFNFLLISLLASAQDKKIFSEVYTIDDTPVEYVSLTKDEINHSNHSVAYTLYDETGAFIFYDQNLFNHISDFSKFLIIEHEKAHHKLGHTFLSKLNREKNNYFENASHFRRNEKDADCEAGYQVRDFFKEKKASDISAAIREIYLVLNDVSKSSKSNLPDDIRSRINTIITCFEGKLLPRPEKVDILIYDEPTS